MHSKNLRGKVGFAISCIIPWLQDANVHQFLHFFCTMIGAHQKQALNLWHRKNWADKKQICQTQRQG